MALIVRNTLTRPVEPIEPLEADAADATGIEVMARPGGVKEWRSRP